MNSFTETIYDIVECRQATVDASRILAIQAEMPRLVLYPVNNKQTHINKQTYYENTPLTRS